MHPFSPVRIILVMLGLLLSSCGGRSQVATDDNDRERTQVPDPWGSGGQASCETGDGVRVCGGPCRWLDAPECPGYGCTPAHDRVGGSASDAGVCWADAPAEVAELCNACPDGMVCAQRRPDELVCVPESVCAALWDLGATDVCRYAYKSAYDHRALPEPKTCPFDGRFCGGACGDCGGIFRCTGRSPAHPYGICVGSGGAGLFRCGVSEKGQDPACLPNSVCAVLDVPAADEAAALRYGVCMDEDSCLAVAAELPGGLRCFDAAGKKVGP